jgi:4-amino-4-deoxy-L-arabinose transferase-like glycosyltransferase
MTKYTTLLLVLLLVISFALRVWGLSEIPSMLNRDEAALGYNALSLVSTGKDEWGVSWPLSLQSFGDYKLPGYVWATMPFVWATPRSVAAVRLPSVLAGVAIIGLSFLLARDWWGWSKQWALITALMVACTPVWFFYSRYAFEALLGLALLLGSLWCWWGSKTPRVWRDVSGVILWVLAVFSYNTPLLLTPFLLAALIYLRGKKHWKHSALLTGALVVLLGVAAVIFSSVMGQKKGITLFSDELTHMSYVEWQARQPKWLGPLDSEYVYWVGQMAYRVIASHSPYFLVTRGGEHQWHQLPQASHLTWSLYILGLVGLVYVLYQGFTHPLSEKNPVVLAWLWVVTLSPAVITVDAPHATRSLFWLLLWSWMAAWGVKWLFETHVFKGRNQTWAMIAVVIVVAQFAQYTRNYFTTYETESKRILEYSFLESLDQVQRERPGVPVAVVDPTGYFYIQMAWYAQISPQEFAATVVRQLPDRAGLRYGEQVGRFHFVAKREDRRDNERVVIDNTGNGKWFVTLFE